ncbi:MAG: septum formation protein [Myxococcota bacterium]
MKRLVLASTSRYRRALLERFGLPFDCISPKVDERAVVLPPRELAAALSRAKAEAVIAAAPDALIIGSDQVATIDGEILTKPGTVARAEAQLAQLAGRTHELITGVCIVDAATGERREHLDVHRITLRALTAAEIADYVARDQPLDCGGSYKIEGLGISLMDAIEGEDFTAITGLPMIAVRRLLGELGLGVLGRPA